MKIFIYILQCLIILQNKVKRYSFSAEEQFVVFLFFFILCKIFTYIAYKYDIVLCSFNNEMQGVSQALYAFVL